MHDVSDIRKHWRECGPPIHIGLALAASAHGIKLTADADTPEAGNLKQVDLPEGAAQIAEIAAGIAMPGQEWIRLPRPRPLPIK
ncbi:hypothetical protein [Sphingomonas paeninsulae]|uniref:hypothetical protein n=1 Tax=Sphingomonas paeninsulae TaxID=2319844 RepID=UPI0013CEDD8E|nr:hypothetical protein [Sphingomonas paeninsulae]